MVAPTNLDAASVDVDRLVTYIGEPPHRVGHYFERLVHFWLAEVQRLDQVEKGLQIRDDTRTIGELDFVFADAMGQICHWEVAVKFYLHDPTRPGSHFPGPDARDDFETKAKRLFEHQLPLSVDHRPDVTMRQALVKGCLFGGWQAGPIGLTPDELAPGCERGTWLRGSQVAAWCEHATPAAIVAATKPYWFTPGAQPALDPAEWSSRVAQLARPSHMAFALDADGAIAERIFVVADDW